LRAIKDYDEAIRLDPKDVWAFFNRASARSQLKEYDRAIKDYDEAIRLDPKHVEAFLSRGVACLNLELHDKSIRDFQSVLTIGGWEGPNAVFAVIQGNLAARLAKDHTAAKKFLDDSKGKLKEDWPFPVVRFLRGELDEKELLKLADTDDKRTEARCYLGLDHLIRGKKEEAAAHFKWVNEHGNQDYIEYGIAIAELDRLEKGKK
jgi:lipoprotein NlpI